ncbi:hypothetical protein FRC17_006538, partial [Serendipita sp. 399]
SLPAEAPPLAIFWAGSEDAEAQGRSAAALRRIRGTQLDRYLNAPQTKQYIVRLEGDRLRGLLLT